MRLALLGAHPDGLSMVRALAATGRHALATYTVPPSGEEAVRSTGLRPARVRDFEEVLADPSIDAVIVASELDKRPEHLRRVLQSERHALCVWPVDRTPDIAYEAALIQKDTRSVLLPLLPHSAHPAFARLAQLIAPGNILGTLQLLRADFPFVAKDPGERSMSGSGTKVSLPGWDILRSLGGEITEVLGFAAGNEISLDDPLLLAGKFGRGGIFEVSLLPGSERATMQLLAMGDTGRAELVFPQGLSGPSILVCEPELGSDFKEAWEAWDPWPDMVTVFETALAETFEHGKPPGPLRSSPEPTNTITWQTAIDCLELDDAARRSVERRRSSILEYQEASEEVGFKGTMTLVGCAVLWLVLITLILSRWEPRIGWIAIPILLLFLALQLLYGIVPKSARSKRPSDHR
jgi:predicted dehydrogenase